MSKRSSRVTYVDLIVLCGILVLLVAILMPTIHRTRETGGRVRCASNLRQIGQALLLYSSASGGAYPRTTYVAGDTVTPTWGTNPSAASPFGPDGPAPNDITAAFFLLIRTEDIGPDPFVCDRTDQVLDNFGDRRGKATALMRSNFTDVKRNLSYSFQNPYFTDAVAGKLKWDANLPPTFAIAADKSPGTAGDNDNVLAPTTQSAAIQMKLGNSNNHDSDGQHILFGDGHVEFHNNPFAGIDGDNIFTTQAAKVIDSPASATDSILLPTDD